LRYVDIENSSTGEASAVRSTTDSLGARAWALLDQTQTVAEIVSTLRASAALSSRDSYALECAVASAVEQFMAVGRVRLVRRGVSEIVVHPTDPLPADR
jgi:hypothetical protein